MVELAVGAKHPVLLHTYIPELLQLLLLVALHRTAIR